jgi:hypothetical protein
MQLIEHPIGTALGFMMFKEALFRYLLRLPLSAGNFIRSNLNSIRPLAGRGVCGALKFGMVAQHHINLEGRGFGP